MGQKIHPNSVRLRIIQRSNSYWYADKIYYSFFLSEDRCINIFIFKSYNSLIIFDIVLYRRLMNLRIRLHFSKFNFSENIIILDIIFKMNKKYLEKLRQILQKICNDFGNNYLIIWDQWRFFSKLFRNAIVNMFMCIWKNQKIRSSCIRKTMVLNLEKRTPFRLVIKSKKKLGFYFRCTFGIRIQISGRVNDIEIARVEKMYSGNIPLLIFFANLDFSNKIVRTIYGILGIKVWILNHFIRVRIILI